MKSKDGKHNHYVNRQITIETWIGVNGTFNECTACIRWSHCRCSGNWLCLLRTEKNYYRPVKIRKTTMRKLLKRRRAGK